MNISVDPRYRGICRRLLQSGHLPLSQCGDAFIRKIKHLFDAQVVNLQKAGGGQKIVVLDPAAFQQWFTHHFPETSLPDDLSLSRIQGVARCRKSKAIRSNLPVVVPFRSMIDGSLSKDAAAVACSNLTQTHGIFSFLLANESEYALSGRCALIENFAVFLVFERLNLDVPVAIWTAGLSSNRFLSWLQVNCRRDLEVLHLPDYDPAGLTEFVRYRGKLGAAVRLHIPSDIDVLFRKYSDPSLLEDDKNQRMLMQLRKCRLPEVQRVVSLIENYNAGLEHEALFINTESADDVWMSKTHVNKSS